MIYEDREIITYAEIVIGSPQIGVIAQIATVTSLSQRPSQENMSDVYNNPEQDDIKPFICYPPSTKNKSTNQYNICRNSKKILFLKELGPRQSIMPSERLMGLFNAF
jgi:hypothetical protein